MENRSVLKPAQIDGSHLFTKEVQFLVQLINPGVLIQNHNSVLQNLVFAFLQYKILEKSLFYW